MRVSVDLLGSLEISAFLGEHGLQTERAALVLRIPELTR